MQKITLDEIKKIELDLLLVFDKFCKEKGLRYYLHSGTLIGAVRHKGFIPWDDDIDVCMPRPDYDRLMQIWNNDVMSKYQLCSNKLKNMPLQYAKLKRTDTKVRFNAMLKGIDTSVWIDIFPFDGFYEDTKKSIKHWKKVDSYRILASLATIRFTNPILAILTFPFLLPFRLIGAYYFANKGESLALKLPYETSKYVGDIVWGFDGDREKMLRSEFEKDAVDVEFEGHKFPAFACWDYYLRSVYGDYMKLPPENKRKSHHMNAWIVD